MLKMNTDRKPDAPRIDPIHAAIVHVILVAGFLAVHFGVARLW